MEITINLVNFVLEFHTVYMYNCMFGNNYIPHLQDVKSLPLSLNLLSLLNCFALKQNMFAQVECTATQTNLILLVP